MNDPVAQTLFAWGTPIIAMMTIANFIIIISQIKTIRYQGKTYVRKPNNPTIEELLGFIDEEEI